LWQSLKELTVVYLQALFVKAVLCHHSTIAQGVVHQSGHIPYAKFAVKLTCQMEIHHAHLLAHDG
jgi:hypothetical protein